MKMTVLEAREQMRILVGAGAVCEWNESSLHGSWLSFDIKSVYCDRVEAICEKLSDNWAYEIDNKRGIARFDLFDVTKDNTKQKKHMVKVRQWLTRKNTNPIPMRTMEAVVLHETEKAYKLRLNGHLNPSSTCNHCGRRLTHPVSLMYGLGPVCGGHFHINPCETEQELKERYEEMKKNMEKVTWEGWVSKRHIESFEVIA